jgi:uncharacterized C2H2 Zn-finger protein
MLLKELFERYRDQLEQKYGHRLLPAQRRAIDDIITCRTPVLGEILSTCPHCGVNHTRPHSCGNRNCPVCQNHLATVWLDKQRANLLPVRYYLLTFTLPAQLRTTAYNHQKIVYNALLNAAKETISDVARNPRHLGAMVGLMAVLHTNSRMLDFHPHVHIVLPAGGVDSSGKLWISKSRKHLFPHQILKTLFREKFLAALRREEIPYNHELHKKEWVVNIRAAGKGEPALKYLSRYLYRGVIQERNILNDANGRITFKYLEAKTDTWKNRTLPAVDFLHLLLTHVLPKRFRRVRSYGFLHGNAATTLHKIQLILKATPKIPVATSRPRLLKCPDCGAAEIVINYDFRRHLNANHHIRGSPT